MEPVGAPPADDVLTIAGYKVENLDPIMERVERTPVDDPDDDAITFTAIADHVVRLLGSPDVLALQEVQDNDGGGIYKVKAADYNMARPAGQWQTYDIRFRAPRFDTAGKKIENARITVYHNGTMIHKDVEIPDKTGGGQAEAPTPGPLQLQDHGNKIRFRNIWFTGTKIET